MAQPRPDAAKAKQQFIGTYRLLSYVSFDEKGVERKTDYTVGQISYDAAGRMSAQLMVPNRPAAGRGASEAQRAAAAAGYVAYFGRYEIDPERGVVTHHVEEIPPNFTDVLLLREGRVVAQGPIEITLTAENLERTFGMPLELESRGDRFAARAR